MRVLWFNGGLLPEACQVLGVPPLVTGGWIPSQLEALRKLDSTIEFCVLCLDHQKCDVQVGNVRYVSFGRKRHYSYRKIPVEIENEVRTYIREFTPDIIHIHGTEYFFSRFSDGVYCGKPVVISIQGLISGYHLQYNGGLTEKEVAPFQWNLRRLIWGTTMCKEQTFWRETRVASEKDSIQRHRYFMGRTDWDKNWIRIYNPTAKYYHVNETLRPAFFTGIRSVSEIEPFTIYSSASAGYPLKGGHWLLWAIYYLKPRFPKIKLRIAAALPRLSNQKTWWQRMKDDYYAAYLRALICKLELQEQVELLPSLRAEEVASVLRRSHVFCLPSLIENSPNSLGEAMLLGVPCIATYVGGVPSILEHGKEGLLCPSADIASLVAAIEYCFEHPQMCEQFVRAAYKTALVRHNSQKNALRTLEVYREIIDFQKRIVK